MLKKGNCILFLLLCSAFGDYRFKPISLSEIPSLQCSVSLLHSFENAQDYKDWIVFLMI